MTIPCARSGGGNSAAPPVCPASSQGAKSHPAPPNPDGQVAALVEWVLEKAAEAEAIAGGLEIDKGDLITEAAAEPLVAELHALFARHGPGAALSARAQFTPTRDFHVPRHSIFSPEQNLEIDPVIPVSASVRVKAGRGGMDGREE